MATKKFITYKCNRCKRTKEFNTDNLHAFINLCTITQGCSGRLAPIARKNLRDILPSAPVSGLTDWQPRNSVAAITSTSVQLQTNVQLSSDSTGTLTLAVQNQVLPIVMPTHIRIVFAELSSDVQNYVEFDFNMAAGFTTITGADNSSSAKVLSFTESDSIVVYINGVHYDETNYTLVYDQNQRGYMITFKSTVTYSATVKIVVFPSTSINLTAPLTFVENQTISNNTTAWLNASALSFNNTTWTTYTCSDVSGLPRNTLFNIYPGSNQILSDSATFNMALAGNSITLDQFAFLLANDPFTVIDRNHNAIVFLNDLVDDTTYVRYYSTYNFEELQVSNLAISALTAPIQITQVDNTGFEWLSINVQPTKIVEQQGDSTILGPSY